MKPLASEDDPRVVYVPIEEASRPKGGICHNYIDHWWSVHPERGVMFWRSAKNHPPSAQCNSNEHIARRLCGQLWPFAEVRQIPLVSVKVNPRDYL